MVDKYPGKVTDVNPEELKASCSMVVTLSGISTSVRPEQPLKALSLITVTVFGMDTFTKEEQFRNVDI